MNGNCGQMEPLIWRISVPAGSKTNQSTDRSLALILNASGAVRIEWLAAEVGWSSRHLNRMFRRHTGLSTQSFSQTIRFQHACKQLYSAPSNTLDTAIELGYFDQSHLLNDYKKYLHKNPSIFANRFKSDFYNP